MSPRFANKSLVTALALTLVATAVSAGDATDAADARRLEAARAHAGDPVETVRFLRPINGYEVLGQHSVLVWQTNTKAWLVDVRESAACRASALDNSVAVGIETAVDTLNTRNGYVTGRDSLRCKITQIREVDVPAMRVAERSAAAAPKA